MHCLADGAACGDGAGCGHGCSHAGGRCGASGPAVGRGRARAAALSARLWSPLASGRPPPRKLGARATACGAARRWRWACALRFGCACGLLAARDAARSPCSGLWRWRPFWPHRHGAVRGRASFWSTRARASRCSCGPRRRSRLWRGRRGSGCRLSRKLGTLGQRSTRSRLGRCLPASLCGCALSKMRRTVGRLACPQARSTFRCGHKLRTWAASRPGSVAGGSRAAPAALHGSRQGSLRAGSPRLRCARRPLTPCCPSWLFALRRLQPGPLQPLRRRAGMQRRARRWLRVLCRRGEWSCWAGWAGTTA